MMTLPIQRPPGVTQGMVEQVCDTVMIGVVRLLKPEELGDARRATEIIRSEVRRFFTDQRYVRQREEFVATHECKPILLVDMVVTCVERIRDPEQT